jgi:hypothetical protein
MEGGSVGVVVETGDSFDATTPGTRGKLPDTLSPVMIEAGVFLGRSGLIFGEC